MSKFAIFDMDGVIADTEPLHRESCRALLKNLNLDIESILPKAYAHSKREFWNDVIRENALHYTAEELTRREFELLIEIIKKNNIQPTSGLYETLQKLQSEGFTLAIASSSDREYVQAVLDVTGLKKFFFAIACGNDVSVAKPAPDVYLRALELCEAKAEQACAIEDSDTGIAAAKAAGLYCIGYDAVSDEKFRQKFTFADAVVHDMSKVYLSIIAHCKGKN